MLNLIPMVKEMKRCDGILDKRTISVQKNHICDSRIERALTELQIAEDGVPVEICLGSGEKESYKLRINEEGIRIEAGDAAGAFYAVQTLKQIFTNEEIPYLEIQDRPDFEYRGFYHDITRGKIPTIETMKMLIDRMASYKMNSLQLYVEHVYEFEECKELNDKYGYYTKKEMQELDEYCKERFIDFIPSLSAFSHMYEVLELEQYKHLRVLKDFVPCENFWHERMEHHTLDPLLPESEALVMSLIDQYMPAFTSKTFNICCDETFDLTKLDSDIDTGKLYVDFTKKIIDHVQSKGKKVMMWGDILLQHPEYIKEIPEDIVFLNWDYAAKPPEAKIQKFSELGRKQILCSGTNSWRRLCEDISVEEKNISQMAEYGYQYGALGILNTNWGDWGNPASLDLAMYGLVLGAAKSWSVSTELDEEFYHAINERLYGAKGAVQILREISNAQDQIKWMPFVKEYLEYRYKKEMEPELPIFSFTIENVEKVQNTFRKCQQVLNSENWNYEEAREEMLICIEGICVMAELMAKMKGIPTERLTNTEEWLAKYSTKWVQKNKPCELFRIQEMFLNLEAQ